MTDPETDETLSELLQHAASTRFDDGFADRVMARLEARHDAAPDETLVRISTRLLPWLAAAAVALAMIDWRASRAESVDVASASPAPGETAISNWSSYQ